MFPFDQIRRARREFSRMAGQLHRMEEAVTRLRQAVGRIEARECAALAGPALRDREFSVYSQWGEDGIIEHLVRSVEIRTPVFVEFGVEDYTESNTRFLLQNRNWSGLVMDGSEKHIRTIRQSPIYWRHNLKAVVAFITRENINALLEENGVAGEIGLLSVDVDGNDYWIWNAIHVARPAIVIVEYNALFGPDRAVTIPYRPDFVRSEAHYSHLYAGASLPAMVGLGRRKGYAFVGCNGAGNNAFFVRRDLRPEALPELTAREGFVASQFREARNASGELTFLSPAEAAKLIDGLPLEQVEG